MSGRTCCLSSRQSDTDAQRRIAPCYKAGSLFELNDAHGLRAEPWEVGADSAVLGFVHGASFSTFL